MDTAIVCGNGINAHTLVRTLARLGWTGRVVLLWHETEGRGFAGCLNRHVEQWAISIRTLDELPELVEKRYGREGRVFVFFTDERYHPVFAEWLARHPDSAIRCHLGSARHMPAMLDRYEFCRFIETRRLASVPRTIRGEEDPFAAFGDSFIVRPRLSWFGVSQRERVKLVAGRDQFGAALADYAARGLSPADLSFQERLSIRNRDNVSICGWYGPAARHLHCSRKVLQYPPKTGGGDVVELVPPPPGVQEQAQAILAAMEYDGPFELEFVFDERAGEFKVTELNPRFWLQHGLIEAVSGCALVGSYLGRGPLPADAQKRGLRYWVNPMYTAFRLLKLDPRSLRYYASPKSWKPFSAAQALRYAADYARRRLAGRQRLS